MIKKLMGFYFLLPRKPAIGEWRKYIIAFKVEFN
jgi:hypothetical protein